MHLLQQVKDLVRATSTPRARKVNKLVPRQPIARLQTSWAAAGRPEQPLPPLLQTRLSIWSLLQRTARVHRACAKHRAIVNGTTADASLAADFYRRSLCLLH